MTKRELEELELKRQAIDRGIDDILFEWIDTKEPILNTEIRERLKNFLRSEKIGIMVEKELPEVKPSYNKWVDSALRGYRQRVKNRGFTVVVSL